MRAVSIGRVREDESGVWDAMFVILSHNSEAPHVPIHILKISADQKKAILGAYRVINSECWSSYFDLSLTSSTFSQASGALGFAAAMPGWCLLFALMLAAVYSFISIPVGNMMFCWRELAIKKALLEFRLSRRAAVRHKESRATKQVELFKGGSSRKKLPLKLSLPHFSRICLELPVCMVRR